MLNLSTNAGAESLYHTANFYRLLNYSVIPVYGSRQPEQAKVAAVDWKSYQSRRANAADFERWFRQQGFAGLAIVTGNVSRLVVLDFDDAQIASEFALRHPHLTETRTVQSAMRCTPHYYYALPATLNMASQKAPGIDLLSDGRYVVAPPTIINESEYKVTRGGQPRLLSQADIILIQQFLRERTEKRLVVDTGVNNGFKPVVAATPASTVLSLSDNSPLFAANLPRCLTPEMLVNRYYYFVPQVGRNEALFRQALFARDAGWTLAMTETALVDIHVHEPAAGEHSPETVQQRHREAIATIKSAYSRPPGKTNPVKHAPGLPNTIREEFLKRGEMALLRVLDGLLMQGVRPGMIITEKIVCNLLKGTVGRYSILKALATRLQDKPVFEPADPSPGPPSHTNVAASVTSLPEQKMLFVGATESDKKRGRPPAHYRMPDIAALCARLNLKYIPGDALEQGDLTSVRKYREGMHRELIKRRPGHYARDWLANRLGVSVRSMQRYRQGARIQVKPTFREMAITWQTMGYIPVGIPTQGIFLEDETGRRYPPLREIARKLLKRRKKVRVLYQCENYYWHEKSLQFDEAGLSPVGTQPAASAQKCLVVMQPASPFFPQSVPGKAPGVIHEKQTPSLYLEKGAGDEVKSSLIMTKNKPGPYTEDSHRIILPVPVRAVSRYTPKAKRYYRQPLPNTTQEKMAQRLYATLRMDCTTKSGYFSLPTARRLVEEYGCHQVTAALRVVKARKNVVTPAGFIIAWLRSEAKVRQNFPLVSP